jgi:hypothetical protein
VSSLKLEAGAVSDGGKAASGSICRGAEAVQRSVGQRCRGVASSPKGTYCTKKIRYWPLQSSLLSRDPPPPPCQLERTALDSKNLKKALRALLLRRAHHHLAELVEVHGAAAVLVQLLNDAVQLLVGEGGEQLADEAAKGVHRDEAFAGTVVDPVYSGGAVKGGGYLRENTKKLRFMGFFCEKIHFSCLFLTLSCQNVEERLVRGVEGGFFSQKYEKMKIN